MWVLRFPVSANSFKHFSKGQINIFFSSLGRLIFSSCGIKLLLECGEREL
jgi:hypothetical protein